MSQENQSENTSSTSSSSSTLSGPLNCSESDMASQSPMQPVMSQSPQFAPAQNVAGTLVQANNSTSHPSTPSPIPNLVAGVQPAPQQAIISQQAANHQVAVSTPQPYPQMQQQSRIPTPQPLQQQIAAVQSPQTISPSLVGTAAPGTVQQMSIQQMQMQQSLQQQPQQIVQPNAFISSQGQTSLTVSLNQPTSGTPTAHIAPAPAPHPAVTPSPVPQLQVIQQPVQNSAYIHPIYATGTHQATSLMFPGSLTIQPAGTFQSLNVNQANTRNIALPQANLDANKPQPTAIMPVPVAGVANKAAAVSAPNASSVVPHAATAQVHIGGAKPNATPMMAASATPFSQGSKAVFANHAAGQSTYSIPGSSVNGHHAFVISPLGVMGANQPSALLAPNKSPSTGDQKNKSFVMSTGLGSKPAIVPHVTGANAAAAVLSGGHFKHLATTAQVISSQAPTAMITSQGQIIGSFQAATGFTPAHGQIAQGINWAAASQGCIQQPTMIQPNTPILIRGSQNGEMFFQSPAAAQHTFQAMGQPQIQAQPGTTLITSSNTPVASVAPSSTTTVTTTSAPVHKPKLAAAGPGTTGPGAGSDGTKSTQQSATTTVSSTSRNLSTILPAFSSSSGGVLPTAQVRPAAAAASPSSNAASLQPHKVKAKPRLSPGPSSQVVQGQVRPTLINVSQTLAIQPKQRISSLPKTTSAAPKVITTTVAATQVSSPSKSPAVTTTPAKPSTNVNVVMPETPKDVKITKSSAAGVTSTVSVNKAQASGTVQKQQPQKAIVKPNILTHVIEGFVILEASDPFPVNRSSPTVTNCASIVDSDGSHSNTSNVNKKRKTATIRSKLQTDDNNGLNNKGSTPVPEDSSSQVPGSKTADTCISSMDNVESGPAAPQPPPPQALLNCYNKNPVKWTVQEVYEFIRSLPGCTDYAEEFLCQEIDGQALMLLKEEHLVTTMNVKLGPALKICSKVSSLREEHE